MKISLKIIVILIFKCLFCLQNLNAGEKIKIGLLVPLSGSESNIGKSVLNSVRLAINKIDNKDIEILPKNTKNDPLETVSAAKELSLAVVKIVIGPIFNNNLAYLEEL